ncbi:MAG: PEP-CTERM sorting domain-containing protein [Chthonomonas sp.]|nr:PEP-CTERM sorting domain-containing protein [Chthonomonas sp.]
MLLIANGVDNRIHRWDPENAVSLGSFSVQAPMTDIAVNQSANEVYALVRSGSTSGVLRYNYNTGNYIGTTILSGSYGTARKIQYTRAGELLVSYDRDVVRFDPSTGFQVGSALYYGDRRFIPSGGATLLNNGLYAIASDSDGTFWSSDFLLNFNPSNVLVSSVGMGPQAETSLKDIVGNSSGSAAIASYTVNSTHYFSRYYTTPSGVAAANVSVELTGSTVALSGAEWGHGERAYGMYYSNGALYCLPMEMSLGLAGTAQTLPGFQYSTNYYRGSAIVVAPEPSSMLAVFAGLGLLIRRRKA